MSSMGIEYETSCPLCDRDFTHCGPCDGAGYQGACSMCSKFILRNDGTLLHEDGDIFAPVKVIQQCRYEVMLPLFPAEEVEE